MTDITRNAFEAECSRYWWPERCPGFEFRDGKYENGRAQLAWAFYQAATAVERERCALVCYSRGCESRKDWKARYDPRDDGKSDGAFECEDAIRLGGDA